MDFSTYLMLVTFVIGIVLFLGITSILPTLAINQNTSSSHEAKSVVAPVKEADSKLILISDVIENRLEKAAAILEFTSRLPEMREPLLLGLFSPASKGIPENADLERRQIVQEILSKYPEEFVSLLFLMPNGTVYLLEPFAPNRICLHMICPLGITIRLASNQIIPFLVM